MVEVSAHPATDDFGVPEVNGSGKRQGGCDAERSRRANDRSNVARVLHPIEDQQQKCVAIGKPGQRRIGAIAFVAIDAGLQLVNVTAGCPYYNPHVQRPALFPPSDGYLPPEDPLAGVARQLHATALLKAAFPDMVLVGSAYSYLQEWLPNVGQRVLRDGGADFVGLGRMVLAYPEMPADVLAGRPLQRKKICRTFSDCTTAPRNRLPSGCYPLDPFYASRPEAARLKATKESSRA